MLPSRSSFQETFDAGLQAFQQEGIANITALKDQLLAAKHIQSKAIEARHAALMKRWSQLLTNSATRKKKLLEAQSHFRKVSLAPAELNQLNAQGKQTPLPGQRFCTGVWSQRKPREGGPLPSGGCCSAASGKTELARPRERGERGRTFQQWEEGGREPSRAEPDTLGTTPAFLVPTPLPPPPPTKDGPHSPCSCADSVSSAFRWRTSS